MVVETKKPATKLDQRFSSPDAKALPWSMAQTRLEQALTYWLTTVRSDGRPHVTPLIGLWTHGSFYFCTSESEQKAKNLAQNKHCLVMISPDSGSGELDVVAEGEAEMVRDEACLQRVARGLMAKYDDWHVEVRDGVLCMRRPDVPDSENHPLVFELSPAKALGFGRDGGTFSQTRWRF
jgi:general stress protein 26